MERPDEHDGVLDARMAWPADAMELMELADDHPTLDDLADRWYFDGLRERINRMEGHRLD
ncbi:MAG: hypothetical protein LKI88_03800 [Bifidobacterium sp.]|jgi:hypothetical protein|nr:hypothetical protein [Bifidobacterium sp.]MCI1865044.1 hypothetical protein [Bifidobacterium sp.]